MTELDVVDVDDMPTGPVVEVSEKGSDLRALSAMRAEVAHNIGPVEMSLHLEGWDD